MEISTATNQRVLHIAGLDDSVTKDVLIGAFSVFGEIQTVDIPIDSQSGKPRGFGFVEFMDSNDSADAVDNMDQSELYGRTIRVKFSSRKPPGQLRDPKKAVWADELYYKKILARPLADDTGDDDHQTL